MAEKQVTIKPAEWSPDAAEMLQAAIPFGVPEDLRRQIENEGARLFEVIAEGQRVAFYMLRVDRDSRGNVGVIVAGAGSMAGFDLVVNIVPQIERQFINCHSVQFHTARPGLVKKMTRQGYGAVEMVLRKKIQ